MYQPKIIGWLNWHLEMNDSDVVDNQVISIRCTLCKKHVVRIKNARSFSDAFIIGVSGALVKKDQVMKHAESECHKRAVVLERDPYFIHQLTTQTTIGML